ncbi:MAG: hypothetical protein ACKVP0_06675 [Pirellulaceae bacterium]
MKAKKLANRKKDNLRSCFWFTYHASLRDSRGPDIKDRTRQFHQVRDGLAFAELISTIVHLGFRYAGPLLNLPSEQFKNEAPSNTLQNMGSQDLVVMVTRPPLNDIDDRRKQIQRSGTDIEEAVLGCLSTHFLGHCDRKEVQLNREIVDFLTRVQPVAASYASLCYTERAPVAKNSSGLGPTGEGKTCGYLLYVPQIFPSGPALLCVFGMAAIETLAWAQHIGAHRQDLLRLLFQSDELHVLMSEWLLPKLPLRPVTLPLLESRITVVFHASKSLGTIAGWKLRE